MSFLDKIVAALTPPETPEQRTEARRKARGLAREGDWLSQIIGHHEGIEAAFAAVKAAGDATSKTATFKQLALLLTGHAQAEESVIYPALADNSERMHAGTGYEEQSMVKVQMALLEKLDPLSQEFLDKLGHIEGAVAHHVYAEENNWFADLVDKVPAADQAMLSQRYAEEYARYIGSDARDPQAPLFPA